MDYRFLLVPDIEIVLIISGWIIATYCVCKICEGIGKKIAMLILTPVVILWVPAMILTDAVQDPTMYDYYRASIAYNIDTAFKDDYYSHLDTDGKPDAYDAKIDKGMSQIDDNIATVGRKHGFGIPDRPGFEELNKHIEKRYFALYVDSMYALHGVPLWSLALYCLIIYGLSLYAERTAKLYPVEDQTEEYEKLQEQIKSANEEINDLNSRIDTLKSQISEKEKQDTSITKKITEKSEKIKELNKVIRQKTAESDAFDD